MSKKEILENEGLFQEACSRFIREPIYNCVSRLMYDIGQHIEECAQIFDFDYEEALGWFVQRDYRTALEGWIADADLNDLEELVDQFGHYTTWAEVLTEAGVPEVTEVEPSEEGADPMWRYVGSNELFDYEEDAQEAAVRSRIDNVLLGVRALFYDDDAQEACDHINIEPEEYEVYEHWVVDSYFGRQLEERGEVVFEFGGMTIWGRCTTGQSIALDHVIREMVRDLPEHHWVWDAK